MISVGGEPKAPVEKLPNSHSWKHTAAPSVRIQKATSSYTRISPRASGQKAGAVMVKRNRNGKIARSATAKREFMRKTAHPNGWPGHVVDHTYTAQARWPGFASEYAMADRRGGEG